MVNKIKFARTVACVTATGFLLFACGGSDGTDSTVNPPPVQPPAPEAVAPRLELLTGKVAVDFNACNPQNGSLGQAAYADLYRIKVYTDAVFVLDTGEACINAAERGTFASVRKISGSDVSTEVDLRARFSVMAPAPATPLYPSGFHRSGEADYFVLGYLADHRNYAFWNEISQSTLWQNYPSGLYRFAGSTPYEASFLAGAVKAPAISDGQAQGASFHSPHGLEVDGAGLFYLLDEGRLRTIDATYNVRTLENDTLGLNDLHRIKSLDADHAGQIHFLAREANSTDYVWKRLSDGRSVNFSGLGPDFYTPERLMSFEPFTVVNDHLLIAFNELGDSKSTLYKVSANGEVTQLSGKSAPFREEDLLQSLGVANLPAVRHIEYGVDGHLYLVLPQGVLRIKDYATLLR